MATKETILSKIQVLITDHFDSPEEAFEFFDKDGSQTLDRQEILKLLKTAEINGLIRGIVARKLIEGYDKADDGTVSWEEFQAAIGEIEETS